MQGSSGSAAIAPVYIPYYCLLTTRLAAMPKLSGIGIGRVETN